MARKSYSPEFRRQAVDLYKSTPGATLRGISADLGVSRHTLNDWVHARRLARYRARCRARLRRGGRGTAPCRAAAGPLRPGRGDRGAAGAGGRAGDREGRTRGRADQVGHRAGRSCAGRPSISRGRRTGEPLPVQRRPGSPIAIRCSPPSAPSGWAAAAELAPMIEMWRQLLKDHVRTRAVDAKRDRRAAPASRRRGGRAARAGSPSGRPVSRTPDRLSLAEHGSNSCPGEGIRQLPALTTRVQDDPASSSAALTRQHRLLRHGRTGPTAPSSRHSVDCYRSADASDQGVQGQRTDLAGTVHSPPTMISRRGLPRA